MTPKAHRLGGIYLLTPDVGARSFEAILDVVHQSLEAGVRAIQYRDKTASLTQRLERASRLVLLTRAAGALFIVNDSVSLTKRLDADGVHLGQSDGDAREARAILGPSKQIGVTCHASRHLAMEAGEAGCDYVAFGAFYPTTTKPSHYRPKPEILSWWASLFEIPCVAIGGITPDNVQPLLDAGADFIAVCQAVWGKDDPGEAVRAFGEIFAIID